MIQSLRPEDRTKAAGLVGLVVAVFALAGFRAKADAPAPTASDSSVFLNPQGATSSTPPSRPDKQVDQIIDYTPPKPANLSNPFKDTLSSHSTPSGSVPAPQLYVPMKGDIGPSEPISSSALPATTAGTVTPVPPEFDSISVEGVVTGGEGVAILKVGASQLVISQGASFGKGYKLVSVTDTHVVIEKGRKQHTLMVNAQ